MLVVLGKSEPGSRLQGGFAQRCSIDVEVLAFIEQESQAGDPMVDDGCAHAETFILIDG